MKLKKAYKKIADRLNTEDKKLFFLAAKLTIDSLSECDSEEEFEAIDDFITDGVLNSSLNEQGIFLKDFSDN
jgi:hypothetical protein